MAIKTASPRPTRRWLRFSLRGLFIAVTIICIWLGVKINAARKQKEAVAAVLKAGGEVQYDYQIVPSPPGFSQRLNFDPNAKPSAPVWLRNLLGDDFFCNVVRVDMVYGKKDQDIGLQELWKLPNIKELLIADRMHLSALSPIQPVTQEVSNVDFAAIGKLKNLEYLQLIGIVLHGNQFRFLSECKRLEGLSVSLDLDKQSFSEIGKVRSLKWIEITPFFVPESEGCLECLSDLPALEELSVWGLQFTDKSLLGLERSKSLKRIYLNYTQVSDEAFANLQTAMPNIKISGQFPGRASF